jgi:hypothetical protein
VFIVPFSLLINFDAAYGINAGAGSKNESRNIHANDLVERINAGRERMKK